MAHRVVLDADWFVINKVKHIKQLAFCSPTLGIYGECTFSLPPGAAAFHLDLMRQSRHSHGLDWREMGNYRHDEVAKALIDIFKKLGTGNLEFFAKGLEKTRLLQNHLSCPVIDLDSIGCPKYEDLCPHRKTTLQKAVQFGLWLECS